MFGFLNVNKPSGISSHAVISRLRKITGIKQIGHAGTLDPLASGVLPVAIGKATKLIDYLSDDKAYVVSMQFGKVSDTYDTEGTVTETGSEKVSVELIKTFLPEFTGEIIQIPPAYSAVHYNGKRLYELARNGVIPDDIPSRKVIVYENEIINFDFSAQTLELYISCSKGTYIRSIVNDIGQKTNAGAVMTKLERVKSSGFSIADSITLTEDTDKEYILSKLKNPVDFLTLNKINIDEKQKQKIENGVSFELKSDTNGLVLLLYNGKISAIAQIDVDLVKPKKVFL